MDTGIEQRRRSTRRPGLWRGRYRARRLRRWARCHVVDVSLGGAAIELEPSADVPAGRVTLELRPVGVAFAPVTFDAAVRHATRLATGGWRVGLEFVDVAPTTRADLDRMMRLFST